MNRGRFIVIFLVLFSGTLMGQVAHVWSTHGVSKFVYTTGVEGNYFFTSLLGIQLGSSIYIQFPDDYILNRTFSESSNYYDTNLGLTTHLFQNKNHHIDFALGAKFYYGPHYKKVAYYNMDHKDIYADVSHLRLEYGLDLGVSYSYKHASVLLKFDTAYKIVRFGFGYCFGKNKQD